MFCVAGGVILENFDTLQMVDTGNPNLLMLEHQVPI